MIRADTIILFGMGPSGLFLARQLKKEGKTIYAIGKTDDIGRYSNVLERYFASESLEEIKDIIYELKRNQESIGGYFCSDQYLTMFLKGYPEIFDEVDITEPNKECLELISNKERLVKYCEKCGVSFPATYTSKEIKERTAKLPLAVKPNIKQGHSPLKKITVLNSMEELQDFLNLIKEKDYDIDDLLFQQYIYGNNGFEYGYGGYFAKGIPITDIFFIQARQYPQGVSCYTIEITDRTLKERIKLSVDSFLSDLQYSGFIQFDLKQDAKTGEIYVLDINPRPWGSISILAARCAEKSVFKKEIRNERQLVWRFPLKELAAVKNRNNLPYKDCKKRITGNFKMVIDLFDPADMKPVLAQPLIMLKKLGR